MDRESGGHGLPRTCNLQSLELAALSSLTTILRVSLPSVVLNAAPPITVALQTALLGRYAHTSSLAAFAAVGTCVGFTTRIFGFLVDGVSSKVGRTVGQRAWGELATHVRLSLRWSLALGAAAVPLLLAARVPLCSWLLALSAEVQREAAGYWLLRSLLVPVQMAAMAATGVLQGFGHMRVNAALTSAAALLELLSSAAVLLLLQHQQLPSTAEPGSASSISGSLFAVGCVTCACQTLLATAALACIVVLHPAGAQRHIDLPGDVFGLRSSGRSSSGGAGGSGADQPLLAGHTGGPGAEPVQQLASAEVAAATTADGPSGGGRDAAAELHQRPQRQQKDQQQGEQQLGLEQEQEQEQEGPALTELGGGLFDEATREFLRDGRDMFIRSMVLQLTFFLALAAASCLGTTVLAAHSIIGQLWVLVSYAVDGFTAAGIVLGSRLYGFTKRSHLRSEAKRSMDRLTKRVLLAGGLSGAAAGLAFQLAASGTIAAFTSDPAVAAALQHGGVWAVLVASQPLNGLLFVFDGLLLATQHFRFIRNYMLAGGLLVFCPLLALSVWRLPGLVSIWLAKVALNVWRLVGAAYLIFWRFLPGFGEEAAAAVEREKEAAVEQEAPVKP